MNASVNGCLSLCVVCPATDWQPVQGLPRLSPYDSYQNIYSSNSFMV